MYVDVFHRDAEDCFGNWLLIVFQGVVFLCPYLLYSILFDGCAGFGKAGVLTCFHSVFGMIYVLVANGRTCRKVDS